MFWEVTLALILTFSPEEKEQRRCVRVARVAGVRLQRRVGCGDGLIGEMKMVTD